jgi:hypothetical protein
VIQVAVGFQFLVLYSSNKNNFRDYQSDTYQKNESPKFNGLRDAN